MNSVHSDERIVNYPPINWRACNSHRGYIWPVDFLPASIQTSTPCGHLVAAYFGKCDHRHYHANCHQYHALRSILHSERLSLEAVFLRYIGVPEPLSRWIDGA